MYYIYHIPGIKIGVSVTPKERVEKQGYSDFEILETHTDIYEVSKREKELQKEYGYKVDGPHYWQAKERRLENSKSRSEAKVAAARINIAKATIASVASGSPSKAGKANAEKHRQCPYCGKEGRGPTMFRYHFENCKFK